MSKAKSFTMDLTLWRVGGNYRFKGVSPTVALPPYIRDLYIESFAMGSPPPNKITLSVSWEPPEDSVDEQAE